MDLAVGAAIGLAGDDGTLRSLRLLGPACKVEELDAKLDGDTIRLLLVTDADDSDIPASLLSATLER